MGIENTQHRATYQDHYLLFAGEFDVIVLIKCCLRERKNERVYKCQRWAEEGVCRWAQINRYWTNTKLNCNWLEIIGPTLSKFSF